MASGGQGKKEWRAGQDAVRRWAERARMAWLVGEGAMAMLELAEEGSGEGPAAEAVVARLEEVLQRGGLGPAAGRGNGVRPQRASSGGRGQRGTGPAKAAATTPWRDGGRALHRERYVVLFLGAVAVHGAWATVAMGVLGDGTKRVLGLWRGCTAESAVARAATENLAGRGLTAEAGLLVVHDGNTAVDAAVQRAWGARALIAYCEQCVTAGVLGHLAERERPPMRQALRAAWGAAEPERSRRLGAVVTDLETRCPGAAARLRRSLEALGTVSALGLPRRLAEHLRGIGPIRELAEAARAADAAGAAGIAAVLPERLPRMRRLIGAQGLPLLAERLAARVAGAR